MKTDPIRIILVDDHKLARESWSLLLGYEVGFEIVHECSNGEEAISYAKKLRPDVMLVDINMSPVNGFEVTRRVLAENPKIKIIGISVNNQPSYANRMLELGAKGFVTKGSPFDEVTFAITEVHRGQQYVCWEIRNMIIS
jgi:DNA-binding NarL/FixJ family response regulator